MENNFVNDVSDTALWIAGYRAQESARPDAIFNDQLAEQLAGERGKKMVSDTPHTEAMAFAMVIRTKAIDRLVEMAVAKGVDTIINIGAGLDTRPYRMNLPSHLRWIEIDFPHTIEYKNRTIRKEPVCALERIPADLSKKAERDTLFARLGAETAKAAILSEGLIGYLTNEDAASLSESLHAIPSFKYWIMDYTQGKLRRHKRAKDLADKLKKTAPIQFKSADPIAFFGEQGWKIDENIFILDEADRNGRKLPSMFPWNILMALFPGPIRKIANRTYGYVMFGKG
jgi:methyltransferase (TIGR00027 family)